MHIPAKLMSEAKAVYSAVRHDWNAVNIDGNVLYIADAVGTVGNLKIHSSVMTFSLLAVYSCPNAKDCDVKDCYALKAQRQYAGTRCKRTVLTWLAMNDVPALEKLIMNQLSRTRKKAIRVHESGDFVSQEYVNMWFRIAKANPEIHFYSYTKTGSIFDFSNCPDNFNIVNKDFCEVNFFDTIEECQEMADKTGGYVCPCGTPDETKKMCGSSCKVCHTTEHPVFFLKH